MATDSDDTTSIDVKPEIDAAEYRPEGAAELEQREETDPVDMEEEGHLRYSKEDIQATIDEAADAGKQPADVVEGWVGDVNPADHCRPAVMVVDGEAHYDPTSVDNGTQNCVECTMAVQETLDGKPAAAAATPGQFDADAMLAEEYGGEFHEAAGYAEMRDEMAAEGVGAQGMVLSDTVVSDADGNEVHRSGHAFNVITRQGGVDFVDGQQGHVGDEGVIPESGTLANGDTFETSYRLMVTRSPLRDIRGANARMG